jgi:hypothetical protein
VSSFATDINASETLAFTKISGPAWGSMSAAGLLTGTPQEADEGAAVFVVQVADSKGAAANATVNVRVTHVGPAWTQNPINLPDAPEGSAYSQGVGTFVTDPNAGETLTFSKVSGPAWASVSSAGLLTGTPKESDEGAAVFVLQVADSKGAAANATVNVRVTHVGPVWTQNPISLPDAPEESSYSQSVSSYATDINPGETLTFTKVSGPAWGSVSTAGLLTGTPHEADEGLSTIVVRVTDKSGAAADAKVTTLVTHVGPAWTQNPINLPDAPEASAYSQSVGSFVKDPNASETLTFSEVSGPAWGKVSALGLLTGTPQEADEGAAVFVVQVTDSKGATAKAAVNVSVTHVGPAWTQDPINLPDAPEGLAYSQGLGTYVKDPNASETLTFTKVSGPA